MNLILSHSRLILILILIKILLLHHDKLLILIEFYWIHLYILRLKNHVVFHIILLLNI